MVYLGGGSMDFSLQLQKGEVIHTSKTSKQLLEVF